LRSLLPGRTEEGSHDGESLERLARNQSLFREVNERIERIAGDNEVVEFICECSDPDCLSTVDLKVDEYERVRSNSTWFFVKAGHDIPEIEGVVSQSDGYAVVEKLVAIEFTEGADPRTDGSS
jgi:hypothetical protein